MDDPDDEFFPLSMSGITLKPEKKEILSPQSSAITRLSKTFRKEMGDAVSCSQMSSVSRLSKSFRKRKGNSFQSCAGSIVGSTVKSKNLHDLEHATTSSALRFCPTCQAPFDIMTIDPNIHANQCTVTWTDLEECPVGELCYNDSIFHYRDYAHHVLAQIRASKGHLDTTPNITSTKSPGSKIRNSGTFKAPLCNSVNGNVSNCKNKLFSDSDSVISLSTNSSKDINIKTSLNRVSNLSIGNNYNCNNHFHTPVFNQDKNQHLKKNQVIYGPEISNKIIADNMKRPRVEDEDTEWKLSSTYCKNPEFKIPAKKRKIENSFAISVNTNVQNQNLTSTEMKLNSEDTRSFSNSQKTNKTDLTILDIIEPNTTENSNSSGEEYSIEKQKEKDLCDSNKVKYKLIKKCKNCKISTSDRLLQNEKEPSISEHAKEEVRATLSVVLSPTSVNLDDAKDEPETSVKVDASCDKTGWRTIGIAAPSATEVDNVKVAVCDCTKTMEVDCSLSQNQTLFDLIDNEDNNNKELKFKFFSYVKEPKQFNKLNAPCHQMSITSYFRTSKEPSTLSLKTCIEPSTSTEVKPCSSSSAQTQNNSRIDNDVYEVTTTSEVSKQSKESAIASWKQILRGMVQKGKSALSVMSDDSIATTDTQTSAGTTKSYRSSNKTCPSYKKIPDTTFVVDAFQYGVIPKITHYFLSHFHYDHYGGLRKSFSHPVYCSKITSALVKMKIGVKEQYIYELELDTPINIRGVLVTALDANHCPGSVMFLFQLQDGRNFLHVGDFRADPKMESYPCFWNLTIQKLFLDTTYCEPKYDFPMQSETVAKVVELAMEHYSKSPFTLFVCGTYTIGKEKVFIGIAEALNCKIWAHPDKRKVLDCIDNPDINEKLTNRQLTAQVHVCRMTDLNIEFLQRYLRQHKGAFSHLVAFVPTGWELRTGKNKDSNNFNVTSYGNITIYGVPYSEHSSFTELKRFVQFLKPEEVIPTVNVGTEAKRKVMQKYFSHWLSESSLKAKEVNKQIQQKMTQFLENSRQKSS